MKEVNQRTFKRDAQFPGLVRRENSFLQQIFIAMRSKFACRFNGPVLSNNSVSVIYKPPKYDVMNKVKFLRMAILPYLMIAAFAIADVTYIWYTNTNPNGLSGTFTSLSGGGWTWTISSGESGSGSSAAASSAWNSAGFSGPASEIQYSS